MLSSVNSSRHYVEERPTLGLERFAHLGRFAAVSHACRRAVAASALLPHVDVLRCVSAWDEPWDVGGCYIDAARDGRLEVLKFARENGWEWDQGDVTLAAH